MALLRTTQKETWNVNKCQIWSWEKVFLWRNLVQVGQQPLNVGDGGGAIQLKVSEKQIQFSGTLERSLGQQKIRNFWKHIKFSFLRENCLFLSSVRSFSNNISWLNIFFQVVVNLLYNMRCEYYSNTPFLAGLVSQFLPGTVSSFLATVHYVGK